MDNKWTSMDNREEGMSKPRPFTFHTPSFR